MPAPTSWSNTTYVNLTYLQNIDALLWGTRWASSTITYSFPDYGSLWSTSTATGYGPSSGSGEPWSASFAPTSASDQIYFAAALQKWANVANLQFALIADTSTNVGDIRAAYTPISGAYQAYVADFPSNTSKAGDVWFNSNGTSATAYWTPGAYENFTILHELGHALGLKHPFAAGGLSSTVLPSLSDTQSYTIMSYSAQAGDSTTYFSFCPTTPMIFDIQAIQYVYGANNSYHAGNDTYSYSDSTYYHEAIWDAGGTDTIQYNGYLNSAIDLRAGYGSAIGLSVYVQSAYGANLQAVNNVWIAYGVTIENAIGGSGNDILTGNDANNSLDGGAGNDTLYGGAGDDAFDFNAACRGGNDAFYGGVGNDIFVLDTVNDSVIEYVGEGVDTIFVDFSFSLSSLIYVEELDAFGSNGVNLTGNAANNVIKGLSGNDTLDGSAGADTLNGGGGNDILIGGAGIDTAIFSSNYSQYMLTTTATGWNLTGIDGNDTLTDIEFAQFSDQTISLGNYVPTGSVTISGATISSYQAVNMISPAIWYGTVTSHSASSISLSNGAGKSCTYYGSFTYNSYGLSGGTLTGYDSYANWNLDYTVQNINLNAVAVYNYVQSGNAIVLQQYALSGNDTITGSGSADALCGWGGNDTLDGGAGNDKLLGGAGNDTLIGGIGNDTLNGGLDSDTVVLTGNRADYIISRPDLTQVKITRIDGTETDIISNIEIVKFADGSTANVTLTGLLFNTASSFDDNYIGGITADTFDGLAGNDTINGGDGSDTLNGGLGSDILNGGSGDDALAGGLGNDTYILDSVLDTVTELSFVGSGIDTVKLDVTYTSATYTLAANVEKLDASLLTAAIILTGNVLGNKITGGTGNDILSGGVGVDRLTGGDGNDTLNGGLGIDTLTGGLGNDTLDGGIGADIMTGGLGDDTYTVDIAGDKVIELTAEGIDLIKTSLSTYTLAPLALLNIENLEYLGNNGIVANFIGTGNLNANTLTGNTGNDVLNGLAGDDILNGGAGNDKLLGGDGSDTLNGGDGNDILDGGIGADTLIGGLGIDTYIIDNIGDTATETSTLLTEIDMVQSSISHILGLNIENLTLTGSLNIDGTGNLLDNILTGNSGSNILDGGAGIDMLYGGAGADTLVYDSADSKINGGAGIDTLKFSGAVLDLSLLTAGKITGIEKLDLTGNGINSLSVNMTSLFNLTGPAGHNLYVTGDVGDSVNVTGSMWTNVVALTNVGGVNYHQYTHTTAGVIDHLYVQDTLTQSLV